MTSRLIVNSIRHTGASTDALTLDSSGNITCNGTATGFGGGGGATGIDFNDDTKISDFNNRIGRQFDDFKTFLNMHYVSKRRDSKFWEYVADECISDETKKLISLWQDELPSLDHFDDYLSGLPHVQSQLYYPVVDGLGLLNKESARDQMSKYDLRSTSRKFYNEFSEKFNEIIKNSLTHNQFIDLSVNS